MKKIYWFLLYMLFDLLIGGVNGGFMPLSQLAAAQCPKITQRAAISITGTGDATVITGDANRTTYVWQWFMVNGHASVDVNVTLKEGSTSTSGAYLLVHAGGAQTTPCSGTPWAIIPAGSNFVINTSASGSLQGTVYYTKEQ